ncbi:MFS transporter, partial [Georgenia sp. 10Sc9-8]|nr:MFS transporter [Georgenia halotolerans]
GPARARAWGLFGAVIGVSTAAGPLLGGVLLAVFGEPEGWRSVFLVNLPVGAVLIPLAARLLPAPPGRPRDRARRPLGIDVVGLLLLGGAVLSAMLPFVLGAEAGLAAAPWWLVGVAAVLATLFWVWERALERRGGQPVLPRSLVRIRAFVFAIGVGTSYFAGFSAIFLATTL